MDKGNRARRAGLLAAWMLLAALAACERGPVDSTQKGFRGTGMAQLDNQRAVESQAALHAAPEVARPARVRDNAPLAGTTYKNVQVLGELTLGEFGRTMNAITAWVSPKQSCAYCHVEGDFGSDAKYTKVVARRMIQMVRHLNADWQSHIANTGVTCYTCHRGNPLPQQVWFRPAPVRHPNNLLLNRSGQNMPAAEVGLSSLPADPFSDFLWKPGAPEVLRVAGPTALPTGHTASLARTEHTYGLMVHISKSLGVNCTFCHNSRSFASWPQSPLQRTTAWHGIRMARDLNANFLDPLTPHFPAVPLGRLGPSGDAAKVNCATCHQGVNKPLRGAQTARYYPALWLGTRPGAVAPAPGAAVSPADAASAPALPASAVELLAQAVTASAPAAVPAPAPAVPSAPPSPLPSATPPAPPAAPPLATAAPAAPGQVPAAATALAAAASAAEPNCVQRAAAAVQATPRIPEPAVHRVVAGAGRLPFHAAPLADCRMQGVFILPGEPVEAERVVEGFTLVWYRNPRTGAEATGWVRSERLQPTTAEAAKALFDAAAKAAAPPVAVAPAPAPAVAAAPAPAPAPAALPSPAKPPAPPPAVAAAPVAPSASPAPATAGRAPSGTAPFAQADPDCIQLGLDALQKGRPVPADAAGREVTGSGRLPFHSAPDALCRMQGVFILPGEPVEADREQGGYTSVWYRNPRTGGEATGWVRSSRLARP